MNYLYLYKTGILLVFKIEVYIMFFKELTHDNPKYCKRSTGAY